MGFRESVYAFPHRWAIAVLTLSISSLTLPAWRWLAAEREEVGAISREVSKQGDQTRDWLAQKILPILQQTEQDADSRAKEALQTVRDTARDLAGPKGRIDALEASLDARGREITSLLDNHLAKLSGPVGKLTADLEPAVNQVNAAARELPDTVRDARTLLARAARTAGHVEQAADKIEQAVPALVADADSTAENVKQATAASAAAAEETKTAMHNLAVATHPLPSWVRIPLSITGAVAPTVAGAVSAAAATGAFR